MGHVLKVVFSLFNRLWCVRAHILIIIFKLVILFSRILPPDGVEFTGETLIKLVNSTRKTLDFTAMYWALTTKVVDSLSDFPSPLFYLRSGQGSTSL